MNTSHAEKQQIRVTLDFDVYADFDVHQIDFHKVFDIQGGENLTCLLYTSPSPRDYAASRMPSSA